MAQQVYWIALGCTDVPNNVTSVCDFLAGVTLLYCKYSNHIEISQRLSALINSL